MILPKAEAAQKRKAPKAKAHSSKVADPTVDLAMTRVSLLFRGARSNWATLESLYQSSSV